MLKLYLFLHFLDFFMKYCTALIIALLLTTSCSIFSSLTSNTTIKPNESFVLGNNQHGSFTTYLKNEGATVLKIYQAPIDGETYSLLVIKPKETVTVRTEKNTALIIENTGNEEASVSLKVRGDLNLGMGYNK